MNSKMKKLRIFFFSSSLLSSHKLQMLNSAANCANPVFFSTNKDKIVALNSTTECTLAFLEQYAECYELNQIRFGEA